VKLLTGTIMADQIAKFQKVLGNKITRVKYLKYRNVAKTTIYLLNFLEGKLG